VDLQLDGAALTAHLVDTPSVSGQEGPLTDAIEGALRLLPHLTVHRDGNTIVARTTLGRPERVILAGHVDTVPVAGNLPSRVEGSRLFGCGTTDMKSGLAVQLRLAAGLTSPSRDVTYVFYECEEVAAERNGLLRLSRNTPELLAGDFAVLMEPSAGRIEGGCQGTLRAEVTAAGQRAHTARSWMGRNAIHEADGILAVLRAYTPREPEVDGLRYHEGLNAVGIRGGVAGNVVPDECAITVNYRFAPDLDGQRAAEVVRSLFEAWPVTVLDMNGVPVEVFEPNTTTVSNGIAREGFGTAQTQIFHNQFPDYLVGVNLQIPIRNRQAQAAYQHAVLVQRQIEAQMQQLKNAALLDVRNTYIALTQGRAQVQAASKARELQQQTFDAEQKKYQLGASTVYNVILTQRDLITAQGNELRALANLVEAKANYERAVGRTLEVNRVTIADAKHGQIERDTLIPGTINGQVVGTDKIFANEGQR